MKKIYKIFLLICILASLNIIFIGCDDKDKVSTNNNEKLKVLKLSKDDDSFVKLNVYFDASKNEKNVDVLKEERIINKEELLGEMILRELIKGPSIESKLKPILPKDTKILSFSIKNNIAYINLSQDAQYKMNKATEEACLKGIVLSLNQIKSIKKVKILINNKSVDTLGGNYDISKPFSKDDINKIRK
ncbi:conserved lipoprotein [Clostridium botulinum C str. Eklund]|nr:conserved lipoprotein [Clostridium botulinum C str. Eklund]NEZ48955.1 GerMN domain-containing protein [Clostridium botulinum]